MRIRRYDLITILAALLPSFAPSPALAVSRENPPGTRIWDTQSHLEDQSDLRDRTNWVLVPGNLLTLEADPSAAASDPGYYGREYSFEGDPVVESEHLTVAFNSKKGTVSIYSSTHSLEKKAECLPLHLKGTSAKITGFRILQNTGHEASLEVSFTGQNADDKSSAVVSVSKQILEVKPTENMTGISLHSDIEYGITPSFVGDDLIFGPKDYPSTNTLHIPADNVFLGLLTGQNDVLVLTWPNGNQKATLFLGKNEQEPRLIESIEFENDGKSVYLSLLEAPGIWHREQLKPSYLEKNVTIDWKRPFSAKWKTQLAEAGVKTSFTFRESPQNIWRAIVGRYIYPVWFEGDKTFYRLGKKIPPKGESIVYFLEGRGTPDSVLTPVDIMRETLGRQTCDAILDLPGRKLRSHHRRAHLGIRRAATCGVTAAIEEVFKANEEVEKKEYVVEAVDDMVYFVTRHVERLGEYRDFARDMIEFLNLKAKSNPDIKPFLDSLLEIAQQIPQEYEAYKENIKTLTYAAQLAEQTKALTGTKSPDNLKAVLKLGEDWRRMGGAQDELLGKYHSISRNLFQQAGYGCVNLPLALDIAKEIRGKCRMCLRSPDGYEIWADY